MKVLISQRIVDDQAVESRDRTVESLNNLIECPWINALGETLKVIFRGFGHSPGDIIEGLLKQLLRIHLSLSDRSLKSLN